MVVYKKNKLQDINTLGVKYVNDPTPELAEQLLDAFGPFIEKFGRSWY